MMVWLLSLCLWLHFIAFVSAGAFCIYLSALLLEFLQLRFVARRKHSWGTEKGPDSAAWASVVLVAPPCIYIYIYTYIYGSVSRVAGPPPPMVWGGTPQGPDPHISQLFAAFSSCTWLLPTYSLRTANILPTYCLWTSIHYLHTTYILRQYLHIVVYRRTSHKLLTYYWCIPYKLAAYFLYRLYVLFIHYIYIHTIYSYIIYI